jgi:hypothetical protein
MRKPIFINCITGVIKSRSKTRAGHVGIRKGEMQKKICSEYCKETRPHGTPRCVWEDKEIGCESVEWIQLAQKRIQWQARALVTTVMYQQVNKTRDLLTS